MMFHSTMILAWLMNMNFFIMMISMMSSIEVMDGLIKMMVNVMIELGMHWWAAVNCFAVVFMVIDALAFIVAACMHVAVLIKVVSVVVTVVVIVVLVVVAAVVVVIKVMSMVMVVVMSVMSMMAMVSVMFIS